jgi:hypothetical protein
VSVHDLQAPREDRALLAYPPLTDVGALLEENRRRLQGANFDILGRSFQSLRSLTRQNILDRTRQYLTAAGEPVVADSGHALFLAGHQPELFHPGVWLKNFALNGLARAHEAIPLNLVVDNDTAKSTSLSVPSGEHVVQVPFDHWQSEVPFEERGVLDEALFRDLPRAVAQLTGDWNFTPFLSAFWAEVERQGERDALLGERFAAARRTFERRWGCANLEVPLSQVCQTEAFAWFACHVLENLPKFVDVYNTVVQTYRRDYGIRSRHHPVPDLASDGDWIEAPFWAWRAGRKRRERLFTRRTSLGLEMRAGRESWATLRRGSRPEDLIEQYRALAAGGYKVRTRALTTTLFARLFVGDIFLHGLGGGKYDELTDQIMRQFYNIEPPAFLVLTGTLLLPLPRLAVSEDDRRRWHALERDLWWNPQRHLNGAPPVARELGEEKKDWIYRTVASSRESRQRFETLRLLTGKLRPFVCAEEEQTRSALEQTARELRVMRARGRRDYAFCLYPEEALRSFCERVM